MEVCVSISIRNLYSHNKVSFKFEAINGDEIYKTDLDISYPFFLFEGLTEKHILDLETKV